MLFVNEAPKVTLGVTINSILESWVTFIVHIIVVVCNYEMKKKMRIESNEQTDTWIH